MKTEIEWGNCARCGHAENFHQENGPCVQCNSGHCPGFEAMPFDASVKAESLTTANGAEIADVAAQIVECCKIWGYSREVTIAVLIKATSYARTGVTWKNPLEGTGLKVSPNGPNIAGFDFTKETKQ